MVIVCWSSSVPPCTQVAFTAAMKLSSMRVGGSSLVAPASKRKIWLQPAVAGTAAAADITGAGATFPYPIYAKWAEAYKAKTGVGLNYQSIGSGGGIQQIKNRTVDFGASDAPLSGDDLAKTGLLQFPMVMG